MYGKIAGWQRLCTDWNETNYRREGCGSRGDKDDLLKTTLLRDPERERDEETSGRVVESRQIFVPLFRAQASTREFVKDIFTFLNPMVEQFVSRQTLVSL